MSHEITREIQIDAAHRVPDHGSKCKNLHGHRYVIQATCSGPLFDSGPQSGMVVDFGFLKEEMMAAIDVPADHGTILYEDDSLYNHRHLFGKLLLLPCVPTAENLAAYWFEQLAPRIEARTDGRASLVRLRVYETPNCWADYCGGE
jgi:6-pyruvoyltetrahydropterin/6-carboxytetrahydropterin synthase